MFVLIFFNLKLQVHLKSIQSVVVLSLERRPNRQPNKNSLLLGCHSQEIIVLPCSNKLTLESSARVFPTFHTVYRVREYRTDLMGIYH